MNCIIVEDQPPAQRLLKKYIEDVDFLVLKATFSDAIKAMEFLKTEKVDVVFLDIHLPKFSGIDFLKTIQQKPHVILTTAFPDYALESYEFDVVDYLLKPFSFPRFLKAVSKLPTPNTDSTEPNAVRRQEIFIKSGYEHVRIAIGEIFYIQSDTDYAEIHLADKKYLSGESLKHWLGVLAPHQFVRVHKSYIINTAKIEKVVGNQIYLSGGFIIPIGRAYKEAFAHRFLE